MIAVESRKRLRAVVRALLATDPMFGSLALRMRFEPGDCETLQAVAVDRCLYSSAWVAGAQADELKDGVRHVVMAVALKHQFRRGDRDEDRWNEASRWATLPYRAGVEHEQAMALHRQLGTEELSCERIYDLLPPPPDEQQPQQGGGGDGDQQGESKAGGEQQPQGGDGQGDAGEQLAAADPGGARAEMKDVTGDMTEAEQQAAEQEADRNLHQALQAAKAEGKEPGGVQALLNRAHVHALPWRDYLARYMRARAKDDYSWSQPNRRYIDNGLYLPSRLSPGMGPLVFAVDTSGSMNVEVVEQAWAEVRACCAEVEPEAVVVMMVDMQVQAVHHYAADSLPETLDYAGGGGTAYSPAMEAVRELPQQPDAMIYLTDLICRDYGDEPSWPVLWCSTEVEGTASRRMARCWRQARE